MARLAAEQGEIDAEAGGRGLQALFVRQLEEDVVPNRTAEPGIVGQLRFELAGIPAGVAEGDQVVLWTVAVGDSEQHILRRGHGQLAQCKGGLIAVAARMQHEAAIGLDRATGKHRQALADDRARLVRAQLLENVRQIQAARVVDHQPHRAFRAVLDDIDQLLGNTGDGAERNVVIKLRDDLAPNHVKQITDLAKEGFYDGVVFHRVIPGFMAQGGDPTGTGTSGSKKPNLKQEFSKEPHVRGVCSMARTANPDSANSQFFICFDDARFLDGQYTVWGEVIEGMEHVDALPKGEPPRAPGKIVKATVV